LIGFCVNWSGAAIPQPLAERFAASLALGARSEVGLHVAGASCLATITGGKARGWQPARTARGEPLLLMGHIDNRAELRRVLERPVTADDATLYAAAYSKWGDDVDLKVIGQYATILWSAEDLTLRLSRSPIGGPPLHIWHDAERLIVATASRAIFATGEVEQKLDEQKLADSLFLNYSEGERGWFEGVSRLAKGTRAVITEGGVKTSRYYDLASLPDVRLKNDAEYVEAATALFEQGTRAALDGFSRPAVSISGGYDSQAVAAFALKVRPEARVLGLTSVPEAGWDGINHRQRFGDERAHVEAFAALHPRFDSQWIDAAGLSFDHKLNAMFMLAGVAPRNAMNLHWIHEVHRTAKQRGCDVVLTGALGNASFSFDGSGTLPSLLKRGQLPTLLRELRAAERTSGLLRYVASQVALPLLPNTIAQAALGLWHGKEKSVFDGWCPLNPKWAAEMQVEARSKAMGFDPHFRPFATTKAWRMAVMGNAANEGGDLQAAFDTLHGIPQRDPTAYRPLVEFCMGIPDDQYLRNGKSRWLAKRMLKGMVPDMVLNEKRRGLQGADWHLRLGRQRQALHSEITQLQSDPQMAKRFDLPALAAALADWPEKTPDGQKLERLQLAVSRALTTARFIHYVEGRNEN
jgi:asparagine synthase (glutamine-hydrolysing)